MELYDNTAYPGLSDAETSASDDDALDVLDVEAPVGEQKPERYTSWNRTAPFRFLAGAIAVFFGFFLFGHDILDRLLRGPDYDRTVISVPVQTSEHFATIAEIEEYYGITVEISDPVWSEQQIVILFNQVYDSLPAPLLPHLLAFYRDLGIPTVFTFQTPAQREVASVSVSDTVQFDIRGFQRNHESIIHEIGHLLHFYLIHTDQDVEAEFRAFNEPFEYLGTAWRDLPALPLDLSRKFVSTYATSAFPEDFAETFRFIFRWPYAIYDGTPYSDDVVSASLDADSPLGQKVQLLRDIVASFE